MGECHRAAPTGVALPEPYSGAVVAGDDSRYRMNNMGLMRRDLNDWLAGPLLC